MYIADEPRNTFQAPSGAACWGSMCGPTVKAVFLSMPLLTEVRQGKLGCSEGESPSRLMEELVFRTKEMNGKV